MIKKIRIKNFKCYGPKGIRADFNLAKINFIFGDNSSGKSTFLQFLKILADTCDHVERYNRRDIDRYLFRHEAGVVNANIRVVEENANAVVDEVWLFRPIQGSDEGYEMVSSSDGRRISKEDLDKILPVSIGADHVVHIEANRSHGVESHGALTRLERLAEFESVADAEECLNSIFTRLGIRYRCVKKDGSGITRDQIHDMDFDIDVPLKDVGTGIDGLVKLAFALNDWHSGILAIEEPETSVNESQMAALAQVLVEEALTRKTGQLIVECHSKIMALQLVEMVRSGNLVCGIGDNANLNVMVIEKTSDGSQVTDVKIDGDGNVDWPRGFFPAEGELLRKSYGVL